jgi:hypothetical protein
LNLVVLKKIQFQRKIKNISFLDYLTSSNACLGSFFGLITGCPELTHPLKTFFIDIANIFVIITALHPLGFSSSVRARHEAEHLIKQCLLLDKKSFFTIGDIGK